MNPPERQRSHRGLIGAAFVALPAIAGTGPEWLVNCLSCPFDKRLTYERRALPPPMYPALLATALGDRRNAGVLLQRIGSLEAAACQL